MAIIHEITMESLDAYIEGQERIRNARVSKAELPVMIVTAGSEPEDASEAPGADTEAAPKKTRKPKPAPAQE